MFLWLINERWFGDFHQEGTGIIGNEILGTLVQPPGHLEGIDADDEV